AGRWTACRTSGGGRRTWSDSSARPGPGSSPGGSPHAERARRAGVVSSPRHDSQRTAYMSGKKVLVVDDEPFILRSLTFVLRKEGFEVSEAMNGEEAMEKIRAEKPGLVLLDVMMPKKNGYEVLSEVKSDDELKSTYVIMLTAKGQEADRVKGLSLGENEYMTKPFSPMKIVE